MGRELITNEVDSLFRESVEGVLDGLSAKSTFLVVLVEKGARCTNCVFDEANKASAGKYNSTGPRPFTGKVCPVCGNKGTLDTVKKRKIPSATVKWSKAEKGAENTPTPAGELPYGYARVKVKIQFERLITKAESYIADGIRCRLVGMPNRRGLKTIVILELVVKRDD